MRELLCSLRSERLDSGKSPAAKAKASQQVHTMLSRTLSRLALRRARDSLIDRFCFSSPVAKRLEAAAASINLARLTASRLDRGDRFISRTPDFLIAAGQEGPGRPSGPVS